jgi:hypothetical protein
VEPGKPARLRGTDFAARQGQRSLNPKIRFFSAVKPNALLADREWLDEAAKTIGQFWQRKNAWRNGLTPEKQADGMPADANFPLPNIAAKRLAKLW